MKCPGLHALYAELEVHFTPAESGDASQPLRFSVQECDERYRSVVMDVAAPGMKGTIKAFLRPGPQAQAAWEQIRDLVTPGEFSGQRALIVGGSRGLGEVTAKLLAAGGADVRITYCQGKSDADAVVREIADHGGSAASLPCDVRNADPCWAEGFGLGWLPSHLYYYATPHIDSGCPNSFSRPLFDKYCDYYLQGFYEVVRAVRAVAPDMGRVYCPSTVFIDELPRSMLEYALAKAAAETLCEFLEQRHRGLKIYRPRLPRMATDQTAGLLPGNVQDPARAMRDSLRDFHRISAVRDD